MKLRDIQTGVVYAYGTRKSEADAVPVLVLATTFYGNSRRDGWGPVPSATRYSRSVGYSVSRTTGLPALKGTRAGFGVVTPLPTDLTDTEIEALLAGGVVSRGDETYTATLIDPRGVKPETWEEFTARKDAEQAARDEFNRQKNEELRVARVRKQEVVTRLEALTGIDFRFDRASDVSLPRAQRVTLSIEDAEKIAGLLDRGMA